VPEHQQFGVLGRLPPGRHQNTAEQTANEYADHPAMMAVRRPRQIEYSSPTGFAPSAGKDHPEARSVSLFQDLLDARPVQGDQ
jgi:hypothetical protein